VSQHLPVPLMDLTTYAKAYKDGLWKWKTDEATDRIRELEERLHERDLAVAALSQDRDEAYRRGVRDGIERVRISAEGPWCGCADGLSIEDTCNAALASYDEEEVGRE